MNASQCVCQLCSDSGWVCEAHPEHPFEHTLHVHYEGTRAYTMEECGGAGMPCKCNKASPPWKFKAPETGRVETKH